MAEIQTIFNQFATASATVLSAKRKDWPKVKRMSKAKNADVWQNVWTKTARPAAIKSLKAAGLGLKKAEIEGLADEYGKSRKLPFIKQTSQTDVKRLTVLARSKGDLEGEIKTAGISRPSRVRLIEDNESLESIKNVLRLGHSQAGFTKRTWKTTSNKPCEICRAREGETVKIDKPYKSGSMTAHAHPRCSCEDFYE